MEKPAYFEITAAAEMFTMGPQRCARMTSSAPKKLASKLRAIVRR
jgi:hypothetical protein